MFSGCTSLASVNLSSWDTSSVLSMDYMFDGCTSLVSPVLTGLNVSSVTDMEEMFKGCTSLVSLDLSSWNVSALENASGMFSSCEELVSLDLSGWNTSSVTSMDEMFADCYALSDLRLSGWDTPSVKDMSNMFSYCVSLESLEITEWDTSAVKSMYCMFERCSNMRALDLSGWDVSAVTDMYGMFNDCKALVTIDLTGWNPLSLTSISSMFSGCKSLVTLDIPGWDISSVTSLFDLFNGCSSLESINLSGWNTSAVEHIEGVFWNCESLVDLDLTGWDTSAVTTTYAMFRGCSSLPDLDLSEWDTSSLEDCHDMFLYCSSLKSLDCSGWDTSSVTDISLMFGACEALLSLDLSDWNTSAVTDMGQLFDGCSSLTTFDGSGWDTSSVTDMSYMFCDCSSLSSVDLAGWNTSALGYTFRMFFDCRGLTTLDLSGWDTSSIFGMEEMFQWCSSLVSIYVGDSWSTGEVSRSDDMFYGCTSLVGGNGTTYDQDHTDAEYARVDAPGTPGYLTLAGTTPITPTGRFTASLRYNEHLTTHRDEDATGATIPVTWDDSWFVDLDPTVYDGELHELATTACVLSSAAYCGEETRKDGQNALIQQDLRRLGFKYIEPHYNPNYDQHYHHVAYCLAVKQVEVGGESFPLVAVVIRGTPGNCEWESNFHVTSTPDAGVITHEGFQMAAQEVEVDLLNLIRSQGIDLSGARFLVTGHSRGAAVANLIAHFLSDGLGALTADRVFAFTFACPNVTTSSDVYSPDYWNIHNFENPEDFVPKVPLALWDFGKYGVTHVLPSRSNCSPGEYRDLRERMDDQFVGLSGGEHYKPYSSGTRLPLTLTGELFADSPSVKTLYTGFKFSLVNGIDVNSTHDLLTYAARVLGHYANPADCAALAGCALDHGAFSSVLMATVLVDRGANAAVGAVTGGHSYGIMDEFTHAHTMETYLSWMLLRDQSVFKSSYRGMTFACPVDVYGYDAEGNLVVRIVDEEVDGEVMANGLAATCADGIKYVDVPSDGNYRFEVVPRGEGEMTVACEEVEYGSPRVGAVSYTELPLADGSTYQVLVDADDANAATPFPDDVELVGPGGDVVEPYYASDDASGELARVSVAIGGGAGTVVGDAVLPRGGVAVVHASPLEGALFLGWYEGGVLVSEEPDYEVCAKGDVSLVAEFSVVDVSAVEVEVAGQAYTGKALTPKPTVTYRGEALVEGTDYELSWTNNVNVGTATVTVRGIGAFGGLRDVEFRIDAALIPIYRMYNTKTSEHLWTKSKAEYNACGTGNYRDWRQENVAWYSPNLPTPASYAKSTQGDYVYVYRLYDKGRTGDHIYLTYGAEMKQYLSNGWVVDKGAGFWTLKQGATISGKKTIPIYRAYNPKLKRGKHHYTPSKNEYDTICKKHGWKPEGTKFYVIKK